MDAASIREKLACSRAHCDCHKATGPNTHCPTHADTDPSLTVHDKPGGGVLVNCKGGCDQAALVEELKRRDLWPSVDRPPTLTLVPKTDPVPRRGDPAATYDYRDTTGRVVAQKA